MQLLDLDVSLDKLSFLDLDSSHELGVELPLVLELVGSHLSKHVLPLDVLNMLLNLGHNVHLSSVSGIVNLLVVKYDLGELEVSFLLFGLPGFGDLFLELLLGQSLLLNLSDERFLQLLLQERWQSIVSWGNFDELGFERFHVFSLVYFIKI